MSSGPVTPPVRQVDGMCAAVLHFRTPLFPMFHRFSPCVTAFPHVSPLCPIFHRVLTCESYVLQVLWREPCETPVFTGFPRGGGGAYL